MLNGTHTPISALQPSTQGVDVYIYASATRPDLVEYVDNPLNPHHAQPYERTPANVMDHVKASLKVPGAQLTAIYE